MFRLIPGNLVGRLFLVRLGGARAIALIMAIACGLRLAIASTLAASILTTGDITHDLLAQNLLAGKGFSLTEGEPYAFYAPGYAAFLALSYKFLGRNWLAVGFSQAILVGLATGLTFLIARAIFNRRAGLVAAALVALNPYSLYQSSRIIDTSLFTVLLLGVVWLFLRLRAQNSGWGWVGLGLLLGLGCLVRSTMLVIFIAMGLWLLLDLGWHRARPAIALCLVGMLLVITPWTVRNFRVMERLILIEAKGIHNLYMGNNPLTLEYIQRRVSLDLIWSDARLAIAPPELGDSAQTDRWYRDKILQFIYQQPLNYLKLLGAKFLAFWSIQLNPGPVGLLDARVLGARELVYMLSYTPLLVLGLIGMFLTFTHKWETRFGLLILSCFTLAHVLVWTATRLRAPLDPLLAVFASYPLTVGFRLGRRLSFSKFFRFSA